VFLCVVKPVITKDNKNDNINYALSENCSTCTPLNCVLPVGVNYSSLDTISPHYGRPAFSVAGPAAWNCLSDELREPLLTVRTVSDSY